MLVIGPLCVYAYVYASNKTKGINGVSVCDNELMWNKQDEQ